MSLLESAVTSCLPLAILSVMTLIAIWKVRGRIEIFKLTDQGLEIRFGKSGKEK